MDLIWTGSDSSIYPLYSICNVGGNFSSVVNSIDGVRDGSIVVAEFIGDGRVDIALNGQLLNSSGALSLYANNSSMSFVRRSDAGFFKCEV